MLPCINGKSFLECTEEDLMVLVENADYRENEYIDYKLTFAYLDLNRGRERDAKKAEFKSDICAFANAEGGYLLYGIGDINGCASSIIGVEIPKDNTDRFELERRNDLNNIQPKTPPLQFAFIKLKSEKYVVIICVKHDSFSPYIHMEDEKNYKVYRRYGNGKRVMPYTELRQMFIQSLSFEQSVYDYIRKRINHYCDFSETFGDKFMHIMMLPETFMDSSYRHNMFVIEKTRNIKFGSIFSDIRCNTPSVPCVDGIRYVPYDDVYDQAEGYVGNNGVVEACLALNKIIKEPTEKSPGGYLPWSYLWDKIHNTFNQYISVFRSINTGERVFICLSIVGCRNVSTDIKDFSFEYNGKIDRDIISCEPIVMNKIVDEGEIEMIMKELYISFLLSIGVKHDKRLADFINEVYGSGNE